ncbi:MAG TPA: DNA methyltransferase, partial [Candidatus Acetothermia bacterium]|nr:DNA methyltransferase [Candidatus Acetothermia bacterium]
MLTDPHAQAEISASLDVLLRVIGAVPPDALSGPEDPWLHFYEQFLAAYDPKLRKDAGAYYTPVEVVQAQVRLVGAVLTDNKKIGKGLGFADPSVITLDPAAGTGTYLLGVIEHALKRIEETEGSGAVPSRATALADNLYGFEIMVGPFAVCELRVSRALQDKGARLPRGGIHIYLTDTLESPSAEPLQLPLFLKPIADQHAKALQVKSGVPVIVCLGNPPYDRHEAADESNKARTGGWVRWGDDGKGTDAILADFVRPAIEAGHGLDIKNLYNLYVYFWRWALWKVFEAKTSAGPGVVSFISAASYLDGDAFSGMREHMRRLCDEIWILDLGGEGRGTRKSENVFAIQTPVAIALAARYGRSSKRRPATVHYARIEGTREEKLRALAAIEGLESLKWEECPREWQAPFRPVGHGEFFKWPSLTDLFPWHHSGVMPGRTWVVGPNRSVLEARWLALCTAGKKERAALFKNSPTGQKVTSAPLQLPPRTDQVVPVADLPSDAPLPCIVRYAFRSLDRQYVLADARLLDRPGPPLWAAHGDKQIYMSSLLTTTLGTGPALTACAALPDRHHFRGSFGGKDVVPLYRDSKYGEANILPGLLDLLARTYGQEVAPEDFLAYVYGILAQPAFTERFADELEKRELRVPVTKGPMLFWKARDLGAKLLWLHTYGERFVPKGFARGKIPPGRARCVKPVPDDREKYPEWFGYNETTQTL